MSWPSMKLQISKGPIATAGFNTAPETLPTARIDITTVKAIKKP